MRKSLIRITPKKVSSTLQKPFLLAVIMVSLVVNFLPATGEPASSGSYGYKFTVNGDGFTRVDITFQSTEAQGSSWVVVPKEKFNKRTYEVTSGNITKEPTIGKTEDYVNQDYYFYEVFEFSFTSSSTFQMEIQFNMSDGALIIERADAPDGMFLSPLIGFDPQSSGSAEVFFPSHFEVQKIPPSGRIISNNRVSFDSLNPLTRLQIQFEAGNKPDTVAIEQGIFTFNTVKRYENYAQEILNFYNNTYASLTDLFNVSLGNVDVQFFIPEFDILLSVGGYIPFIRQRLGKININIFFVRAVNGIIEVIALHELVHHFLWKAGLSPDYFLWFHEGAAQFVSIETVDDLGYVGAVLERERLEQSVTELPPKLGFLEEWTPANQPDNIALHYVASYYIVRSLADNYGGMNFYQQFFKLTSGLEYKKPHVWEPNEWLAFHLSMAANKPIDIKLRQWGFDIDLVYTKTKISSSLVELIYKAERAIDGLSLVFQPYKLIAEFLYQQALLRLERGDVDGASQLLNAAITIANLAPLLTLLTLVAIFAIIAYILLKRTSKPSLEIPMPPPTYQETNA
jgi:hypothetical protein